MQDSAGEAIDRSMPLPIADVRLSAENNSEPLSRSAEAKVLFGVESIVVQHMGAQAKA